MYPHDDTGNYLTGYEYGLNVGFLFRKNVAKDLASFYMMLSTGPHYESGTPHRQANGFLFSNNLCAGIDLRVYKTLYLDVRPGIRHISNAKLRVPNAGLNDITFTEGFFAAF
ncbi:MAG: acyloxyacyl hydrolase [Mucilaginibacter sp.]